MIRHVSSTPSCRVKRVRVADHRRVQQHLVRRRALAALQRELHVELDRRRAGDVRAVRVDDQPDPRRRVELDDELVRLRVAVAVRERGEAELRRVLEHEPELGLRRRQLLAGADEERDAGPAPVLDVEPQRRVRLRGRAGRDAVDVEVAVVLAADVVARVGLGHRAEERDLRVLERPRVAARRRLHRARGDDLHQVVDDHVAQRADRVVEVAAILDAEALGHRDLDAREVVPAPERLEHRVREAQVEDLLEAHLPEVVVDPVELRLVEVLVQLGRERARRDEVVAERLLDDDARVRGQAGVVEALDHAAEEERRDLEVEDRLLRARDRVGDAPVRGGVARSRPRRTRAAPRSA